MTTEQDQGTADALDEWRAAERAAQATADAARAALRAARYRDAEERARNRQGDS
jgi:hypothetical protein